MTAEVSELRLRYLKVSCMDLALVVGTRPEMIKMSPVIKKLRERRVEFCFIMTGQHYDYSMSMKLVEELGLPAPSSSFQLENSKPAAQIGEMMTNLEPILEMDLPVIFVPCIPCILGQVAVFVNLAYTMRLLAYLACACFLLLVISTH
jgi:hypothetical protein